MHRKIYTLVKPTSIKLSLSEDCIHIIRSYTTLPLPSNPLLRTSLNFLPDSMYSWATLSPIQPASV